MARQEIVTTDPGSDRLVDAFNKVNNNDDDQYAHFGSRDGHPLATDTEAGFQSGAHRAKTERALDVETSQRVAYVSPTGSDTSGDGTSANRWKTIQHAVNQARTFMQPASSTSEYQIVCAAGTYEELLIIPPNVLASFNSIGRGGIRIVSESGVASDVVIRNTSGGGGVLCYGSCTLEFLTIENDAQAVSPRGSSAVTVFVKDCILHRYSLSDGGFATIDAQVANVVSRNNTTTTGRRFQYGLAARFGSTIAKVLGQPTGYTANETASNGGAIR